MGGAVSAGEDNDGLIDNLMEADYIKTASIERVFRAVDRADYYLPDHRENAYKDLAWKHGNIHLSAPCIYSEVMESLKLESGMSFLNLGSGTGYLSTLAGLRLGTYGINHGIEQHPEVVEYSRDRLEHFRKTSESFDKFEFCEPQFTVGNCLLMNSANRLYDRVYCGAACPPEHETYMKSLVKVNGILVMPLNDQLLQITRKNETDWETKSVLPVSFASLAVPEDSKAINMVDLPEVTTLTLQEACRVQIRRLLRANIEISYPGLDQRRRPRAGPPQKRRRGRENRMNIVPMSMGMMFLGQFEESEDEQVEVGAAGQQEVGSGERAPDGETTGGRRLRRRGRIQEVLEEETESDDSDHENEDAPGMPEILRQMAAMQRRFLEITRRERRTGRRHRVEDDDDVDQGIGDELEEGEAVGAVAAAGTCMRQREEEEEEEEVPEELLLNKSLEDTLNGQKGSALSSSTSSDEMEVDGMANNVSNAIPITAGPNRQRCSSSTSVSTSYTSGIGTCSSLEEPTEMDFIKELDDEEETVSILKESAVPTNGAAPAANSSDTTTSAPNGHNTNYSCDVTTSESRKKKKTSSTVSTPVPVYEDEDGETTQCYSNCLPGGRDRSCGQTVECEREGSQGDGQDGQLTYRQVTRNYIEQLPIPLALKQFVSFYRI